MDISYKSIPIKVCYKYLINDKPVYYRPCQQYLNKISPIYKELPSWDGDLLKNCHHISEFPAEAKNYLHFLNQELDIPLFAITTGPDRENILFNNFNVV